MGEAINYALGQWDALTLFLTDPHLPIDNNASERALRVAALGRKNFLFVGTNEAGENLAGLYSLIATCEANGVNPVDYLADVLIRVQSHPMSRIDELLPHNWSPTGALLTALLARRRWRRRRMLFVRETVPAPAKPSELLRKNRVHVRRKLVAVHGGRRWNAPQRAAE